MPSLQKCLCCLNQVGLYFIQLYFWLVFEIEDCLPRVISQ